MHSGCSQIGFQDQNGSCLVEMQKNDGEFFKPISRASLSIQIRCQLAAASFFFIAVEYYIPSSILRMAHGKHRCRACISLQSLQVGVAVTSSRGMRSVRSHETSSCRLLSLFSIRSAMKRTKSQGKSKVKRFSVSND